MPLSHLQAYRTAFNSCDYSITRHRSATLKASLQALANLCGEEEQANNYGKGKLIEEFEQEVADLLGKEAAVFLPSGTIAQPLALLGPEPICKHSTPTFSRPETACGATYRQ